MCALLIPSNLRPYLICSARILATIPPRLSNFSTTRFLCGRLKSYHGGIEEDEDGGAHQSCGAQEVGSVGQTQDGHQGPASQQGAHGHGFIQPLAVTGADVDQLGGETHR